ncbi:hypothetical protein Fcan01_19302 [Folsomia candida]|uniref:Uncharacterized protein n=1 Tax=Folsomia candida TaxID=158441 RepID=A0A226DMS2_FOLCA|nr:hypothetical protein Fcan01_19302 [Folsomia candida]
MIGDRQYFKIKNLYLFCSAIFEVFEVSKIRTTPPPSHRSGYHTSWSGKLRTLLKTWPLDYSTPSATISAQEGRWWMGHDLGSLWYTGQGSILCMPSETGLFYRVNLVHEGLGNTVVKIIHSNPSDCNYGGLLIDILHRIDKWFKNLENCTIHGLETFGNLSHAGRNLTKDDISDVLDRGVG